MRGRRTVAIGAMAAVLAACSATTAPTPIVVFVTPPPTLIQPAASPSLPAPAASAAPSASIGPSPSLASAPPSPAGVGLGVARAELVGRTEFIGRTQALGRTEPFGRAELPGRSGRRHVRTRIGNGAVGRLERSEIRDRRFPFSRPKTWVDRHGLGADTYGNILDAETLRDSGLDAREPPRRRTWSARRAPVPGSRTFACSSCRASRCRSKWSVPVSRSSTTLPATPSTGRISSRASADQRPGVRSDVRQGRDLLPARGGAARRNPLSRRVDRIRGVTSHGPAGRNRAYVAMDAGGFTGDPATESERVDQPEPTRIRGPRDPDREAPADAEARNDAGPSAINVSALFTALMEILQLLGERG